MPAEPTRRPFSRATRRDEAAQLAELACRRRRRCGRPASRSRAPTASAPAFTRASNSCAGHRASTVSMCWTRSNVSRVEQHVLLLDAERVRLALAELVVEHAAARREAGVGDRGRKACWSIAEVSTLRRRGRTRLDRRLGRRTRCRCGRSGRAARSPATATTGTSLRWASMTKPLTAYACSSRSRRASSTSTTRPARPARRSATCSRTPPGCRSRRRRADRAARAAADLLERRLRGARRGDRRRARTCRSRDYLRAGRARAARASPRELRGSPAAGYFGPLDDLARASRASCCADASSRPRRWPRRPRVHFPGLGGVLPGFGRWEPNDWGLGFELRDAKQPHWTGSRTRRAPSATSAAAARSSGSIPSSTRARVPDRPRVRRLGARGLARALGRVIAGLSRPRTAAGSTPRTSPCRSRRRRPASSPAPRPCAGCPTRARPLRSSRRAGGGRGHPCSPG